ncbi:MAG: hypothetical protein KDB21_06435 [Acidimicrobiales bacterium]|nr:hypothetical protein [Acidimicrobiales bacterium]
MTGPSTLPAPSAPSAPPAVSAMAWRWVLGFAVWTVFVWSSRIRNVWGADDINTTGKWIRTGIAVLFLALALAVAAGVRRWRAGAPSRADRAVLAVAGVWTIGFWLVRGIGIIVDDHTVGFTVVHTALMIASIGLSVLTLRAAGVGLARSASRSSGLRGAVAE